MSLSQDDKKNLQEIHRLFLQLEKESKDHYFSQHKLNQLKEKIKSLFNSENPDVIRLSQIETHLTENMTLKHFSSYALPFERLLNKNLRDDEFLIVTEDKKTSPNNKIPLIFILDNIRSAFNVGSIFRSAECLNIEKIFLCGYTATPEQLNVEKTALGTHKWVTWDYHFKTAELIDKIKNDYVTIALETTTNSKSVYADFQKRPTAFVLGNERFGLDPSIISLCDEIRSLPIHGMKNSLNVAVAAAVAGFEWQRQFLEL